MNLVLECDSFEVSALYSWLRKQSSSHTFYILSKKNNLNGFIYSLKELKNISCICYEDLFYHKGLEGLELVNYTNFIDSYFNDEVFYHLLDRDGYLPKYGLGIQNAMSYYLHHSIGVISFLIENSIDFVYFRNTPHHSIEWLLAKSAEFLKIPVYVTERHIFPWQYSISKGFYKHRDQLSFDVSDSEDYQFHLIKHINKFVEQNKSTYKKALPSYEKNRLGSGQFKYYNPFKQLLKQFKRPHKFINQLFTYRSYLKHSSRNIDLNKEYVVFFLHYQPERTTLPEGYGFHDQLRAIQILRMALPGNIQLFVKEHPSMFTNQCEPKARNPKFYQWVSDIDDVHLVPIDFDTFSLIDNAIIVSTITGTVGLQSYIRKKPVIFFGKTKIKGKGVHRYEDLTSLTNFIEEVADGVQKIEEPEKNLLKLCEYVSVSGIPENLNTDLIDYHSFKKFQQNAHFNLLTLLLNNKLQLERSL